MKKVLALLLALTCIFSLAACGSSGSTSAPASTSEPAASTSEPAAETTAEVKATHLKLGHPSADGGPYDVMSEEFARLIEEKTEGRYVIDIFPANALGSQEECFEAVTLGTIDLVVTSDDKCVNYVPEFGALGMPFLFDDVNDVNENMNGEMGKYLSDKLATKGAIVISWFENGFRNVTANKAVETPDDIKGVKIRVSSAATNMALFNKCGAVVTNVSFSELYTALQLGTCDAQENPFANIVDRKFYEVQKYLAVTKHVHTTEPLVMSKATWDKLSAEDQAIFAECGKEASEFAYNYASETDAQNLEFLKEKMTVIEPDLAPWKEVADQVTADFQDQYSEILALKK
jgi:tripartite ATP-independent transporter DctP family solute receptor